MQMDKNTTKEIQNKSLWYLGSPLPTYDILKDMLTHTQTVYICQKTLFVLTRWAWSLSLVQRDVSDVHSALWAMFCPVTPLHADWWPTTASPPIHGAGRMHTGKTAGWGADEWHGDQKPDKMILSVAPPPFLSATFLCLYWGAAVLSSCARNSQFPGVPQFYKKRRRWSVMQCSAALSRSRRAGCGKWPLIQLLDASFTGLCVNLSALSLKASAFLLKLCLCLSPCCRWKLHLLCLQRAGAGALSSSPLPLCLPPSCSHRPLP